MPLHQLPLVQIGLIGSRAQQVRLLVFMRVWIIHVPRWYTSERTRCRGLAGRTWTSNGIFRIRWAHLELRNVRSVTVDPLAHCHVYTCRRSASTVPGGGGPAVLATGANDTASTRAAIAENPPDSRRR
ncbi:MAG: hypothetical protein R2720_03570 [Candidatus Nanopelagicales bacterium]